MLHNLFALILRVSLASVAVNILMPTASFWDGVLTTTALALMASVRVERKD